MFNRSTIHLENNNHQKSNQTDRSAVRVNKSLMEENLKGLPKTNA